MNKKTKAAPDGWSDSKVEEALAAMHLIAGAALWTAGIKWLAWVFFARAALDTAAVFQYAWGEFKQEKENKKHSEAAKIAEREALNKLMSQKTEDAK